MKHDLLAARSVNLPMRHASSRAAMMMFATFIISWMLAGCSAVPIQPPMNLTEAGWVVREGPAAWTTKPGAPAVDGRVLVGMNVDGRNLVQFSTAAGTLALAQSTTNTWQVQFPHQNKSQSGRGRVPDRVLWLQLPEGLLGNTVKETEWVFARQRDQTFGFRHEITGERLDGSLRTVRLPPQHVVGRDEHIVRVARRYGFTVDALRVVNPGPDLDWFKPGNTINLPPPSSSTPNVPTK